MRPRHHVRILGQGAGQDLSVFESERFACVVIDTPTQDAGMSDLELRLDLDPRMLEGVLESPGQPLAALRASLQ